MRKLKLSAVALVLAIALLSGTAQAQSLNPLQIELELFASGFNKPVGMYHAGDERLFILEQDQADIEIINLEGNTIGTFLDLTGLVQTGGERGLLGLAFHPNYAENGYFYVNYYNTNARTIVARYSVNPDNPNQALSNSAVVLLNIPQPFSNHNGGHIEFGPDGYLYVGMGDGGSGGDPNNLAQNNTSFHGKMLRLDVDGGDPYSIPADNPFVGSPAILPEIWATGLRNPWKFCFDSQTGDLWMGDVGQNVWEEINFQAASSTGGENYGWRCYEANNTYNTNGCAGASNYTFPAVAVQHTNQNNYCSITGGRVYRGAAYPAMQGHYLFTDYCAGDIRAVVTTDGENFTTHQALPNQGFGFVAFAEDINNEMYIVNTVSGQIFRVKDACSDFTPVLSLTNGTLSVNSGISFDWYLNGELVPNESSSNFTPTSSGSYLAIATNAQGCIVATEAIDIDCAGELGCTNETACNYNSDALCDDGTCTFIEAFTIGGPTQVVEFNTATYTYPETTGSTYEWTVVGGSIISGQGTPEIEVNWEAPTVFASILVQETNADGCVGDMVDL
ncbi:MAG: PQQ-dependent sugar dehydrogenase, partial [Flavobacteriales bacterium]